MRSSISAVDHARDVRVIEPGEELAFLAEARERRRPRGG